MSVGSEFHRSDAATGKERRPTVVIQWLQKNDITQQHIARTPIHYNTESSVAAESAYCSIDHHNAVLRRATGRTVHGETGL